MNSIYNASALLGRIFLVALYVWSGVSKIANFGFFEHYAATQGVSAPLLAISIIIQLVGGLLLLVGYQTRVVALILAIYTIIALLMFYGIHPSGMSNQIIAFAELAAAGGFLMLVARGAGGWSVDGWLAGGRGDGDTIGPSASRPRA